MQQLELFDYRKDYLFDNKNQVAHWYDILKETEDTIIDTAGINFFMWNEDQEDFIDRMCEDKSEQDIANMRFFKLIPTEEDE